MTQLSRPIHGPRCAAFDAQEGARSAPSQGGTPAPLHHGPDRAMNRLDSILGPENWWDEYRPRPQFGASAASPLRLPDGSIAHQGRCRRLRRHGRLRVTTTKVGFPTPSSGLAVEIRRRSRYLYRDGVRHLRRQEREACRRRIGPGRGRDPEPRSSPPSERRSEPRPRTRNGNGIRSRRSGKALVRLDQRSGAEGTRWAC